MTESKAAEVQDSCNMLIDLPGMGKPASILSRVVDRFGSTNRKPGLYPLQDFAREHRSLFADERLKVFDEGKHDNGEGHSHALMECHNLFLQTLEVLLSSFLETEEVPFKDFLTECKMELSGRSAEIFEDRRTNWFLQALVASLDYTYFHKFMVRECYRETYPTETKARE